MGPRRSPGSMGRNRLTSRYSTAVSRLGPGWPLPSATARQNVEDQERNHDDRCGDSDDRDGGRGYEHKVILAWSSASKPTVAGLSA